MQYKDKCYDSPIEIIGAWIVENVMLVTNSSAVEEVEKLHHHECCEYERQMAGIYVVFLEVSDIVFLAG